MGGDLRAGGGANYFVELLRMRRDTLPRPENVYPRAPGAPPKIVLECCALAGSLGRDISAKQIRRPAIWQSLHAKQNVPMISQNESDG
jgi:hypothetical protein